MTDSDTICRFRSLKPLHRAEAWVSLRLTHIDYPRSYEVDVGDDPVALGEPIATGTGGTTVLRYWSIYAMQLSSLS